MSGVKIPRVFNTEDGTYHVVFTYMGGTYLASLHKGSQQWEVQSWPMSLREMGRRPMGTVDPKIIIEARRLLALHKLTT